MSEQITQAPVSVMTDADRETLSALIPMDSPMATILHPVLYQQLESVARRFAGSQLIPKHFQGKPADVFIALHMAHRLGADPIMVLQNMYIVHGAPGWAAKFVIGQANLSRVFSTRISWQVQGEGDNLVVTAQATVRDTGEVVSETVSMDMARAEGWTSNAKYKSMPELMLKYRSATFLVRLHAPEVLMGVPTYEELDDMSAAGQVVIDGEASADVIDLNASVRARGEQIAERKPSADPDPQPEPQGEAAPEPQPEQAQHPQHPQHPKQATSRTRGRGRRAQEQQAAEPRAQDDQDAAVEANIVAALAKCASVDDVNDLLDAARDLSDEARARLEPQFNEARERIASA